MSTATHIFADRAALMHGAADLFVLAARNAFVARGRWMWVLAGGSTPADVYRLLAQAPRRDKIPWQHTWVFWGDERCVPPDAAASNYAMAYETLLRHVPIPEQHIIRMQGELEPAAAAEAYAAELRRIFALESGQLPVFDTIVLGMGTDGHTASLFPETELLNEREQLVTAGWVPQQAQDRISLTLPVINAARGIIFLVAGQDKAPLVKAIVEDEDHTYPAAQVQPIVPPIWLLDAQAASLLG